MSPVSRIVPKTLWDPLKFLTYIVAKYKKIKRGSLETLKSFRKKVSQSRKRDGKSHSVEITWKGDPSALEWFCTSC